MGKLLALFDLLRKGQRVADPEIWKNRQVAVTVIVPALAALLSVANAFGLGLPVSDADLAALAAGIVALVNIVLTYTTSRKIGLPAKTELSGVRVDDPDAVEKCPPGFVP